MIIAIPFLVGFMGGSLALLAGCHVAATKYLGGSCMKPKTKESDNDEYVKKEVHPEVNDESEDTEGSCKTPEPFTSYSNRGARKKIHSLGFDGGKFASKAVLVFNLKYFPDNKRIAGSIKCVQNWNRDAEDAPKQVKFVTKTLKTKKKLSATTESISTKKDTLSLAFTIGPFQENEVTDASLCIQMFGSSKKLKKKWKCYGECYVDLKRFDGKLINGIDLKKDIMPLAVYLTEGKDKRSSKKSKRGSSKRAKELDETAEELNDTQESVATEANETQESVATEANETQESVSSSKK